MTENLEEFPISPIENSSSDSIGLTEKEMLKQFIEKQNKQDKIIEEVIENQQKMMEELRLIQNEQGGRKRELIDRDDSIGNPAKRADLDTSAVDEIERIASEHNYSKHSLSAESPHFEKTGKWFTLKHTFENVSKLEDRGNLHGEFQEHFGITWTMSIYRNEEHLAFYTRCHNRTAKGIWSIEADLEITFLLKDEKLGTRKTRCIFAAKSLEKINSGRFCGWDKFKSWNEVKTEYLNDDSMTIEVTINIKNMMGIYKDNLRSFDNPECSDIVLIVQEKKFHVLKLYLATHSSYFKAMFLGMFGESKKSEIPLTGIDADDFQNYLEVLYGDYSIDEYTVEGILIVADMYDTHIVIKKCQEFLLEKSKKTLKKKLEMSVRYNLEELKKQCLSEINTSNDIRAVLPANIRDLDHSLLADLLEKSLDSD